MASAATPELIVQLETAGCPLALWALHQELHARGVAPCVRWPANTNDTQAEFVTLLADLAWIKQRWPRHQAKFKGWRRLLALPVGCDAWHDEALRQFHFVRPRHSVAHWCATGLDLDDKQRCELMMLPTNAMRSKRLKLAPERFRLVRQALLSRAIERPDRSGMHKPAAIAERRARLWRVYLLSGESATLTHLIETWQFADRGV